MDQIDESRLPEYKDLPGNPDLPKDTTWGLFGDRYELGTLNFLTPERVRKAVSLVKRGDRFNLNLPLDLPPREEGESRKPYRHEFFPIAEGLARDEVLNDFNPQASSQWDGLGHALHPGYGNYNGVANEDIRPGNESKLSIGKWTQTGGIVGRGVLLDVARYLPTTGVAYDPASYFLITAVIR